MPNMVKETLTGLDEIDVVLSWQNQGAQKTRGIGKFLARQKGVDLDAAGLICNEDGAVLAACTVDNLDPWRGAIVHQGDDTGKGKDAGETLKIKLSELSPRVQAIVLTLTSFDGAGFDKVNRTSFELFAKGVIVPLVETFVPISSTGKNAAIMAVIRRDGNGGWETEELSKLVYVDPHFGGNRDSAVTWKDLGDQYNGSFRVRPSGR